LSKFRGNLRSKDKTAQVNELLLKILCHNICVRKCSEMGIYPQFNLPIQPQFCLKSAEDVKKSGKIRTSLTKPDYSSINS
ncbi:MAG: hypothetical protein Q8O41_05515, partial [Candidatus Methanoperedens sp.]|nr:hypothetical protein [Candidatus Methanoperedens sp.]